MGNKSRSLSRVPSRYDLNASVRGRVSSSRTRFWTQLRGSGATPAGNTNTLRYAAHMCCSVVGVQVWLNLCKLIHILIDILVAFQ